MSTEKRVFNKLFKPKTNLSKKAFLSTISELELLTNGAQNDLDAYDNMLNDWVIKYIDLQNEVNSIVNMSDIAANSMFDLDTAMGKFAANAEALGINPFQFDEFSNATLTTGSYENNIEDLNDTLDVAKTMKQL
jgi:predicted ester cyclase